MPRGITEADARAAASGDDNVARHLEGATIRKVVFVPDRLVNLVVG
jgi:leucyl-tRNA synthetase